MFTQCSNCHTVFQLSAEVLRAAGGQVRCGRCGEIFSALARLAEDANSFDHGESAYELEERADSILETVVAEQVAQAGPDASDEEDFNGNEIARLQVLDFSEEDLIDESEEDSEMEFTLPPGDLDRIFVESKPNVPSAHGASLLPLDYDAAPISASMVPAEDDGPLPDIEVISDNRSSDAVPRQLSPADELGTYAVHEQPARPAVPFGLWLGAAVVSALLLIGQVVERNREALTTHGPWASLLRQLYASIGRPLGAAPNLAVFQLRQWGVTGDPGAGQPGAGLPGAGIPRAPLPGAAPSVAAATLRVRASILNTSALLQPLPLLRVTLANRYGARIGARDFEPYEYMGKAVARQLSPGEKVDAILDIRDPGKDAEGFEIDVCLRGDDKKIACANDGAPAKSKP